MSSLPPYANNEPTPAEVAALPGATLLDFGANWCGICQAAAPVIAEALAAHDRGAPLRHLRLEDGRGRPLGRAFGVRLWPTLVVLQDGREVGRVVRPQAVQDVAAALAALAVPGT